MTLPITVIIPCTPAHIATLGRATESALAAGAAKVVRVLDSSMGDIDVNEDGSIWTMTTYTLHPMSAGVCTARNMGINLADGLIFPLDADDELMPDGLKVLHDNWKRGTLVYGDWWHRVGESEALVSAPPPSQLKLKNVAHASWLFHKNDWRHAGGYDPLFNVGAEDWDFMISMIEMGVQPIRITAPIYRKHENPAGRGAKCWSRRELIKQLLQEKHPTFFGLPESRL